MSGIWLSRLRIGLKHGLKLLFGLAGRFVRPKPGLRVLFYHRVNPYPRERLGPVSREISVTPSAFERQLRHLAAHGWRGITLAEFAAMLTGLVPHDPKAILITFDDGYEDNLSYAAPILAHYRFPATVFVIVDFMGRTSGGIWQDGDPPEFGRLLDVPRLRRLREGGWEIGCHTLTHPRLTDLDDIALDRELTGARARLEAELGETVTALAYPSGVFNQRVERAAAAAGYVLAFTTIPGANDGQTRLTCLRRTEVSASDGSLVFRLKLAGALDWLAFKETRRCRAAVDAANRYLTRYARPAGS